MPALVSSPPIFPTFSPDALLAFQFSSWYPEFASWSIKSTVVRPLSAEFRQYLDSDGVFLPEGAEDMSVPCPTCTREFPFNVFMYFVCRPAESSLSDDEPDDEDQTEQPRFAFPELDARIRSAIANYDAVFPKLNFSSPRVRIFASFLGTT